MLEFDTATLRAIDDTYSMEAIDEDDDEPIDEDLEGV